MELKIAKTQLNEIADSIGEYIFLDVKASKDHQNIEWLNRFTMFYQELKNTQSKSNYVTVKVTNDIKADLPEIIGKHLFTELADSSKGKEWLWEMMSVYNQLTSDQTDSGEAASSEIGENYDTENKFSASKKRKKEESIGNDEDITPYIVYDSADEEEPEFE
jgi:hypothetical protein